MKLLDLFAGIGGFSLAAHWMGWETAAFVEKEAFPQKVLAKNFPGVPIYGDIFEFDGRPFRGTVDIVTGGFPCQPFSAAGKRKGRADERHLFPEMLRVIREVKPLWVVAENVRGLLSIENGAVFAEVVTSLESEGYEVVTFCIPASAVEAPHRRDRLWIVASHADGQRERAGHREIHRPNGEISERHDDAESRNADCKCNASHACSTRLQGRSLNVRGERPESDDEQSIRCNRGWSENWLEAATRFCRVDDGVSDRVHRLKALGNSIVPQTAFEIFKAIKQADLEEN